MLRHYTAGKLNLSSGADNLKKFRLLAGKINFSKWIEE